ncbi:MAG: hypothetical protein CUN50_00260 [Candidatus Thermofonsia Clade 1 bacterium]|uniref:Ternary complex associated domain-containing protein n=3 Tax=Candidatus Thermofonsia Clade 1 bacterium TaxID=2364210 RepID=A0A2M8Q0R9_9CHLR|nr:MAG: hypothetical protein CUN50_00260 [Candidatus Thermofonsia Clade 1 bacterium]
MANDAIALHATEMPVPQQSFVSLNELLAIARRESADQMDYYIGVEHLLMALLRIKGGIAVQLFAQHDSSSSYIEFLAQNDDNLNIASHLGIFTPRTSRVIAKAQSYIAQGVAPDERALLRALIEERNSLVVKRILRNLNLRHEQLLSAVDAWQPEQMTNFDLPVPQVQNNDPRYALTPDDLTIIQHIFRASTRVVIERLLSSEGNSYSGARVLLVRAFDAHGREQSPAVVKLHDRRAVLWEKLRYDEYVRDKLPANTAHLIVDALPESSPIGGLKYSFVQGHLDANTTNLRDFARSQPPQIVARWLRERLYNGFRHTWWDQRTAYNFTAWQEYELLLPPALELEALPSVVAKARKIQPLSDALRAEGAFQADEVIALINFTVLKLKPESNTVQLVAGSNAEAMNLSSRVNVKAFDLAAHPNLHRGTIIRRVTGRVIRTRDDILEEQILALAPDFALTSDLLPSHAAFPVRLPNPLRHYRSLLEAQISGTFCPMHGDLHPGNILIGRDSAAWLIDFEWTRDGHTLFDWATLEISLLLELYDPPTPDPWNAAWQMLALLDRLNRVCYAEPHLLNEGLFSAEQPHAQVLIPLVEVRRIVSGLLRRGNWAEYFIPLGLQALRTLNWKDRPLQARRLAYLIVALALKTSREAHEHFATSPDTENDPTETH